jgi:cytochrome c553
MGFLTGLALLSAMLSGCEQDMYNQPKYKPYAAAPDFPNRQSALQPVEDTVAHDADLAPRPESLPVPLTQALLARGRERFDIYCAPCHGRVGNGEGMIAQRGFPHPPSLHSDRLRSAPDSYFYDAISMGFGRMYSYASRVSPPDRWAIVAYIRALQLSQHATRQDVDELGLSPVLEAEP